MKLGVIQNYVRPDFPILDSPPPPLVFIFQQPPSPLYISPPYLLWKYCFYCYASFQYLSFYAKRTPWSYARIFINLCICAQCTSGKVCFHDFRSKLLPRFCSFFYLPLPSRMNVLFECALKTHCCSFICSISSDFSDPSREYVPCRSTKTRKSSFSLQAEIISDIFREFIAKETWKLVASCLLLYILIFRGGWLKIASRKNCRKKYIYALTFEFVCSALETRLCFNFLT